MLKDLLYGEYGLFSTLVAVIVLAILLGIVLALVGSAIQIVVMSVTKKGGNKKQSTPRMGVYTFDVYTQMSNWRGHAKRRCTVKVRAASFSEAEAKAEAYLAVECGFVECINVHYE